MDETRRKKMWIEEDDGNQLRSVRGGVLKTPSWLEFALRLPLFVPYVVFGLVPFYVSVFAWISWLRIRSALGLQVFSKVQKEASKTALLVAVARYGLWKLNLGGDFVAQHFLTPMMRTVVDMLIWYPWFTGKFPAGLHVFNLMLARTEIGDEVVRRFVCKEGGRQVVCLGAGLDARGYRLDILTPGKIEPPVKYFEVDVASTQKLKIQTLVENNIKHDHVTFVPVDFTIETFSECLKRNGWKEEERSVFLWEGVTGYLPEEAVFDTFRAFAKCAKGTLIFFNASEKETPGKAGLRSRIMRKVVADLGEPRKWELSDASNEGIAKLLGQFGLELVEHLSSTEMDEIFLREDSGEYVGRLRKASHMIIARVP